MRLIEISAERNFLKLKKPNALPGVKKIKAEKAANAINTMIGSRMSDTNAHIAAEAQTAALIGAINANNKKS